MQGLQPPDDRQGHGLRIGSALRRHADNELEIVLLFDNNGSEYVSRIQDGVSRQGRALGFPVRAAYRVTLLHEEQETLAVVDGARPVALINRYGSEEDMIAEANRVTVTSFEMKPTVPLLPSRSDRAAGFGR
mgnify:CR=1 FL=1